MPELELALLRRGVDDLAAGASAVSAAAARRWSESACTSTARAAVLCELCRIADARSPARTPIVHGPEFGHTMRITDQRAAA